MIRNVGFVCTPDCTNGTLLTVERDRASELPPSTLEFYNSVFGQIKVRRIEHSGYLFDKDLRVIFKCPREATHVR